MDSSVLRHSGGDPIKTGVNSAKLAIAAFIIPYMIVLQPALLIVDVTILQILWVTVSAIIGMIAIGAGLAMIYPESISDTVGLIVFGIMFVIQFIGNKEGNGPKPVAS